MAPPFGVATVTGDYLILARVRHLSHRGARRAMTAGVNAALTVFAKAMRRGITNVSADTNLKREARRSIGKRFKRGGTSRMGVTTAEVAKVGVKVAKKAKSQAKKTKGRSGGAGISVSNIHWFVLGTKERRHASGHPTGRVRGIFKLVVPRAYSTSKAPALEAARRKVGQVVAREALKGR